MTDVSGLDDLAAKIASGKYPNIATYAKAQAKASQSQELDIRGVLARLTAAEEAIEVLRGSSPSVPRPPTTPPLEQTGWFAASSPYNTVIPASPGLHTDHAAWHATMVASYTGVWMPTFASVPSFFIVDNNTPLRTVRLNWPSCNAASYQVPVPDSAVSSVYGKGPVWAANDTPPQPSVDEEYDVTIINRDTGECWDIWKMTAPNEPTLWASPKTSGCTPGNYWSCEKIEHFPAGTITSGSGRGYATRVAQILNGAGTIRPRDTTMPVGSTWDHALSFAYPKTRSGAYIWPAVGTDGQYSTADALIIGARIQLDPAWDVTSVSMPEWQRQLCRTLQKYGAICDDTGSAISVENLYTARMYGRFVPTGTYNNEPYYAFPWEQQGWNTPPGSGWLTLPTEAIQRLRWIAWTGQ